MRRLTIDVHLAIDTLMAGILIACASFIAGYIFKAIEVMS